MNVISWMRRTQLVVLPLLAWRASYGAELSPVLEVPVKVHQTAASKDAAAPAQMQMMRRPVPGPSTPAAKFPQYQLGLKQQHDSALHDVSNPSLRFLLNLPDGIALIEAKITIDDQPFQLPRQRRIEQILKELSQEKVEVAPAGTDQAESPTPAPQASSLIVDRLRHTMKLKEKTPSPDEVNWVLCNWIDGPILFQLNDNFQRFRADQRPEVIILDRNRDGSISAEEIAASAQSIQECDLNRDGIVQFTEIAAAAKDPRIVVTNDRGSSLVVLLPDHISGPIALSKQLAEKQPSVEQTSISRFDTNNDGELDAEEQRTIQQATPDLRLVILFDTASPDKSRLTAVSVANEFEQKIDQVKADALGITLMFKETPVIFSAGQMGAGDQISIGAVMDGYPLLPKLDPNDDGRLTVRELRSVPAALMSFDVNHDGILTANEIQTPIRVCFGLGATVHLELAGIRSWGSRDASVSPEGPEWFVRMDRNKDHDLVRGEFPGTDEQFSELDSNGDQLISSEEAIAFEKKNQSIENDNSRSNTTSESKNDPASKEEK